jgi:hypothetical protein
MNSKILDNQLIPDQDVMDDLREIIDSKKNTELYVMAIHIYNYGVIQGKRDERKRHKCDKKMLS